MSKTTDSPLTPEQRDEALKILRGIPGDWDEETALDKILLLITAQLATAKADVLDLIKVGDLRIMHDNFRNCPDWKLTSDRDPDCPACAVLIHAEAAE
jgi:hypothetical protein